MIQHSSDGLSRKYLCALRAPAEIQKTYSIFTWTHTFRIYTDIKVLQILNARLSKKLNTEHYNHTWTNYDSAKNKCCIFPPTSLLFSLSWIQVLALFPLLRFTQINCNVIVQVYLKGYPMSNDAFHDNAVFYLLIQNKIKKKQNITIPKRRKSSHKPLVEFLKCYLISKYINYLCHLSLLLDFLQLNLKEWCT